jgi:hypothetical protein
MKTYTSLRDVPLWDEVTEFPKVQSCLRNQACKANLIDTFNPINDFQEAK